MKWRFDNSTDSFSLLLSDFIASRGILIADITEATYMVKTSRTDADVAALVTLTMGDGITLIPASGTAPDKLVVKFRPTDFGSGALLVTENTLPDYYTGAGIKTSGLAKFLEMDFSDDKLTIIPDFIHD